MGKKFYFEALNDFGEKIKDFVFAEDKYEAELMLFDDGLNVLAIREATIFDELDKKLEELKEKYTKVPLKELIIFTRQFSTLFSAGISIVTIFDRLKDHVRHPKLRKALISIAKDVDAGSSLYLAFNKYRDIFPAFYIGMIKVGEEGGVLDVVLKRISAILETQLQTENKIKAATRYPKIVLTAIGFAFFILLTFVIPRFVSLFQRFNATLPLPTRILIHANYIFKNYWWLILIFIIGLVIILKKYKETPEGKKKIDLLILKIPVFGDLIKKIYLARITRVLGLLYQSGIPINRGFEIVSETTGNEIFNEELKKIRKVIVSGTNISRAVRLSFLFPPIVGDMIEAGEESGNLDEMLFKVADYFDEEADYIIQNLSTFIEPILLVFIAAMILTIALGVFLPMWDMVNIFRH